MPHLACLLAVGNPGLRHRQGGDRLSPSAEALPERGALSQFSSVQSLSRVPLFVTHGLQHARPPCPAPTPGVYSNSCPLRGRQWQPSPVLLPGKSHGQRSLVGCSPWGHKESDTTEQLHFHFSLSYIGEGNGNLLQYSCLENPTDRGAWGSAVHSVAKSQT